MLLNTIFREIFRNGGFSKISELLVRMGFGVINFPVALPTVYTIDAFWQTKSTPHNIPADRIVRKRSSDGAEIEAIDSLICACGSFMRMGEINRARGGH
jgi:hypothetical protein